MDREDALKLLRDNVPTANLVKHSLATEAIMRKLARKLGEDEESWGLAGLLHDLDFDQTKDTPEQHGLKAAEMLQKADVDDVIIETIKKHNAEALGLQRESKFEHALAAAETITGLIVATALVYPDKKLAGVKPKSITKRMKKKDFARNVSREIILECEKLALDLEEFTKISLEAMQDVAEAIGL